MSRRVRILSVLSCVGLLLAGFAASWGQVSSPEAPAIREVTAAQAKGMPDFAVLVKGIADRVIPGAGNTEVYVLTDYTGQPIRVRTMKGRPDLGSTWVVIGT